MAFDKYPASLTSREELALQGDTGGRPTYFLIALAYVFKIPTLEGPPTAWAYSATYFLIALAYVFKIQTLEGPPIAWAYS